MIFDVDAYLDGRLSDQERMEFERELSQNATLRAELEENRELREHLRTIRIRSRVQQALQNTPGAPPWFRRWPGIAAIALLIGAGGFWLWQMTQTKHPETGFAPAAPPVGKPAEAPVPAIRPDTTPLPPPSGSSTPKRIPKTPQKPNPAAPPVKPVDRPKASQPMAHSTPKRNPPAPAPERPVTTRGEAYNALPLALQRVLDALGPLHLDTTQQRFAGRFQPAAVYLLEGRPGAANAALSAIERSLDGPNDTLSLLRGFTFLVQELAPDAAGYLRQLDQPGHPWRDEVLWYLGNAALLEGDKKKAMEYWSRVAAGSVYSAPARKGLRLLKG